MKLLGLLVGTTGAVLFFEQAMLRLGTGDKIAAIAMIIAGGTCAVIAFPKNWAAPPPPDRMAGA